MKDSRKWPRFRILVELEVAAPNCYAAESLAQEYVTRANNDNGEGRAPWCDEQVPRKLWPTEPAYVVQAQHHGAKERK